MDNKHHKHFLLNIFRILSAIWPFLCVCVVHTDAPDEALHFIRESAPDTVSPWGGLKVVFSEPVSDSEPVLFSFKPLFYSYSVAWNALRDTATIRFTEPLEGAQLYVLTLKQNVRSISGKIFDPSKDSIVFYTYPAEQEPNDKPELADTLRKCCFGTITTTNDTDIFIITDTSAFAVFLHSTGSQNTFMLKNCRDTALTIQDVRGSDTLIIPDRFNPPYMVLVYSYLRSIGGYYEIGYISKEK